MGIATLIVQIKKADFYPNLGDLPFFSIKGTKKAPELTEALECGMDETRTRNVLRDRQVL